MSLLHISWKVFTTSWEKCLGTNNGGLCAMHSYRIWTHILPRMMTDGMVTGVKMVVQGLLAQKCVDVSCKPTHDFIYSNAILFGYQYSCCLADVHGPRCSDCQEAKSKGCPWTALAGKDKIGNKGMADFVLLLLLENVLRLSHAKSRGCGSTTTGIRVLCYRDVIICPPYPRHSWVQQYERI